jgi:hypothetical protein
LEGGEKSSAPKLLVARAGGVRPRLIVNRLRMVNRLWNQSFQDFTGVAGSNLLFRGSGIGSEKSAP